MNFKRLKDNDYMLANEDKIIGAFLYDCFDEEVGRIEELLVDQETFAMRYCLVTIGGFLGTLGKKLFLPRNILRPRGMGKVASTRPAAVLRNTPVPDGVEAMTRGKEQEIHDYFDIRPYYETEKEAGEVVDEGAQTP